MTIQQAIQRARDNGYVPVDSWGERIDPGEMLYEQAFVDPLFWQSLGKAMGWGKYIVEHGCNQQRCADRHPDEAYKDIWKHEWHSFIDHLADGEDAESFFQNLIHPQE